MTPMNEAIRSAAHELQRLLNMSAGQLDVTIEKTNSTSLDSSRPEALFTIRIISVEPVQVFP